MTDVQEQSVADPEGTNETVTEQKPAKAVKQPHDCFCQGFEVVDPQDTDLVFNTGCEQTTKATFAQGHDARLVSFLVDGHADGYQIRYVKDGNSQTFPSPADAAALASEALRDKALAATQNKQAKVEAKTKREAEREAKKTQAKADKEAAAAAKAAAKNAPKVTGAEVVAGSAEGDGTPLADGQARIKVGRYEYNASIDDEGNATYVDGKGAEQTINRDGYKLLQEATV